jgi:hypothetical protein
MATPIPVTVPIPGVPAAPCLGLALAGGALLWGVLGSALALLLA